MKNLLFSLFFLGLINTGFSQQWELAGNGGTAPATDFVGTTDFRALRFRTDNTFRFGVTAAGRFGINTSTCANVLK